LWQVGYELRLMKIHSEFDEEPIVLLMRPSKCARITFSKVPFLRETKRLLSTDYALFDGRLSNWVL